MFSTILSYFQIKISAKLALWVYLGGKELKLIKSHKFTIDFSVNFGEYIRQNWSISNAQGAQCTPVQSLLLMHISWMNENFLITSIEMHEVIIQEST